jgi:hypothetical protein
MVIVELSDGLGNQMFQYAAGRRLAHRRGSVLKLALTELVPRAPGIASRSYGLRHLNIQERFATSTDLARVVEIERGASRRWQAKVLRAVAPLHLMAEQHFHFDHSILAAPDNVYLRGYWQSERYFDDVADLIRSEFALRHALSPKSQQIAAHIEQTMAVGIHVRRGDYVSSPQRLRYHGTCEPEYYTRCMRAVAERVERPHCFVFSDDPGWVRDNLHLDHPVTIVAHNGPERDFEDLHLMSRCRHFIIANSTFSWWAAWLSASHGKFIVAPARWFADAPHDTCDLLPAAWQRM